MPEKVLESHWEINGLKYQNFVDSVWKTFYNNK